jgi:hypothetical protein
LLVQIEEPRVQQTVYLARRRIPEEEINLKCSQTAHAILARSRFDALGIPDATDGVDKIIACLYGAGERELDGTLDRGRTGILKGNLHSGLGGFRIGLQLSNQGRGSSQRGRRTLFSHCGDIQHQKLGQQVLTIGQRG